MTDPALVLVVDDYTDNRELVVEVLEHAGFRTAQAENGREALAQAFELHPDLILLDLALPLVDGWEVARQLREDPSTRTLKIVALTAHAQETFLERARAAGCDDVITKPVAIEALIPKIQALLASERSPTPPRIA